MELQKLQNFRFKNLFWIDSSCIHTRAHRGAREHDQNRRDDLPQRWLRATVLSSENGQFEQRRVADVSRLLHEGGTVFKHELFSACFCLWGRCTVCCLPSLKEALLIFFQSYSAAGNHENLQDFLLLQSGRICLWRTGSLFIPRLSFTKLRLRICSLLVDQRPRK